LSEPVKMILERLAVTPLETNCYILSRDGKGALVIDPGGEGERIVAWLKEHALSPEWIVCTHGHGDHIGGNEALKQAFPEVRIAVGEPDVDYLRSPMKNMSVLMGLWLKSPAADLTLNDGDRFAFQDLTFEVIAVPGHTPGGICLYVRPGGEAGTPILFSGDVLFARGIGRSDIPEGDHEALISTLRKRLLILPGETVVYPGHGPSTTIGKERRVNPWLRES